MTQENKYARGSEWRQWDLHVHSPASFHWEGDKFDPNDTAKNKAIIDQMITAMNEAAPAVFALMDYWTFDGWFALQERLKEKDAPKLNKTVFPGIELRLVSPTSYRLNAHVLFSDKISDQALKDFQSALKIQILGNRSLSNPALVDLARATNADNLKKHGFDKDKIDSSDADALLAGCHIAEISCESYKDAIKNVPKEMAIGFMPFDTNDGLSKVDWHKHYAYALGLFQSSPIFETRDIDTYCAFTNQVTKGNEGWIENFQTALNNTPRLAVSGSDAHKFKGITGDNDNRGYGDFPSLKITWIKADPTFLGLLQAIKEPAKRSFIGEVPPKLEKVAANKTFYIDGIKVSKIAGSPLKETWLDGCKIPLNSDLVAIIGNKGSGKSALADVVALLGNSKQKRHFSFLKENRFRGKAGEPARQFEGLLSWKDATNDGKSLLCDDPAPEKVEMVKYIPQGHFEELCNEHIRGRSSAFESELRNVIFAHTSDATRLGALDFEQLVEQQEKGYRGNLSELRKNLTVLNQDIVSIEDQLKPEVRAILNEQLAIKKVQLAEHEKIVPPKKDAPTEKLTPEQEATSKRLKVIGEEIVKIDEGLKNCKEKISSASQKKKSVKTISEMLAILDSQIEQFKLSTQEDLKIAGLSLSDVLEFKKNLAPLQEIEKITTKAIDDVEKEAGKFNEQKAAILSEQIILNEKLNEPQKVYQKYLVDMKQWELKKSELLGSKDAPDSKLGLEERIAQIEALPKALAEKKGDRLKLSKKIFFVLNEQREDREKLFKPVQDLIQGNALIREEYKLQFQSNLSSSHEGIGGKLFSLIKQNVGELRGEDESYAAIKIRYDKYNFNDGGDVIKFVEEISALLENVVKQTAPSDVGIGSLLRKDKTAVEVYDYIYGLDYIEPKYSLLFQDTKIEQLSPGQRGALLLIFYLLVDKGRNPIIIDQPEENLDNETVVSLLVPVINEAKKYRQIIMVTHNPNLAVVCDAEQIIYATFNRKNNLQIKYEAGSIEDSTINTHIVNVLEGTKIAFDNRSRTYR